MTHKQHPLGAVTRSASMDNACGQREGIAKADGKYKGRPVTEMATRGHLLGLRGFEAPEEMTVERRHVLLSDNPFNAGSPLAALEMDAVAPAARVFPWRGSAKGVDPGIAKSQAALVGSG